MVTQRSLAKRLNGVRVMTSVDAPFFSFVRYWRGAWRASKLNLLFPLHLRGLFSSPFNGCLGLSTPWCWHILVRRNGRGFFSFSFLFYEVLIQTGRRNGAASPPQAWGLWCRLLSLDLAFFFCVFFIFLSPQSGFLCSCGPRLLIFLFLFR